MTSYQNCANKMQGGWWINNHIPAVLDLRDKVSIVKGAAVVVFVRRCYKLSPGPTEPVPADSQMDLPLVKAEPFRDTAPSEEDMLEQAGPMQSGEIHGGADIHSASCEGSSARAGVCAPKEAVLLWNILGWAGSRQELWP